MGFFIANGRSYKKIWKSTIKKIVIPVLFYIGFAQIFYMFIINKQGIGWCLENAFINLNIRGFIRTVITGDVTHINSLCAHLWYIISYLKITLWIPVLWLICREDDNSKLARRMILIFGLIAMTITDIQRFVTLPIVGAAKVFEMVNSDITDPPGFPAAPPHTAPACVRSFPAWPKPTVLPVPGESAQAPPPAVRIAPAAASVKNPPAPVFVSLQSGPESVLPASHSASSTYCRDPAPAAVYAARAGWSLPPEAPLPAVHGI